MTPEQMATHLFEAGLTLLLNGTYLAFAAPLVVGLVALAKWGRAKLGFDKPKAAALHLGIQVAVWVAWALAIKAGATQDDVQRLIELLGVIVGALASMTASHRIYNAAVARADPLLGYRATPNR